MKNGWFVGPSCLLALALFLFMVRDSAEAQRTGAANRGDGAAYGITVLNVDADSSAPLAGWTMRLYAGLGCTGLAIQTGLTDADGLVSFTGLGAGNYSVQETRRPGYVNVSPLCQDITLAKAPTGGGSGSSAQTYPPGGDDSYAGGSYLVVQLGTHPADAVTLNGPLTVHRGDPGDANRNGLADVQMQVMSMALSGESSVYGPITMRYKMATEAAGQDFDLPQMPQVPQIPPWTPRADYLIVDNGVVAEGGSAFSFGGHNDISCLTDMRRWDPGGMSGTWHDLSPLPEVLDAPRGVLVDGHIYIPGGWDCAGGPKDVLYVYDIDTDTWSMGAPPPTGRAAYGIAALGGQVYRIGGCTNAPCTPSANVDVYNIASDSWSTAPPYPTVIAWQACGAIGGHVYCAGGYDGVAPTHKAYRYTPPPVHAWDDPAMIDLCHQWWAMGAGDNAIDAGGIQSLYLYGGVVDGFHTVTNTAVHYDQAVNSWYYFEPLNHAVYRQGGGSANSPLGNQYSIGGLLPSNPPSVGFTLAAPAGDYYVQHYPTIPPNISLCAGPPPVIVPDGLLEQLQPASPFPAISRFNLSFYLDVGNPRTSRPNLAVLRNTSPLQVQGTVGAIPTYQEVFAYGVGSAGANDLPLYDSSGLQAGRVQHFALVTMAEDDTLVAFANRRTGTVYDVYLPLVVRQAQPAMIHLKGGVR